MKTLEKGLQKFTESERKVNELLTLRKINKIDLIQAQLSDDELGALLDQVRETINTLDGVERDEFIEKVEFLLSADTKNQLWESNHINITYAISTLMQELGRMPSKNEIANKAELSRQTVYKHMKDYACHPQYFLQMDQFRFMGAKVLARVFHFAVEGDMRAAKLYFDLIGMNGQNANNTLIQNQNNYIQINGVVLSQENIKRLNPEQLNTIETILKTALPEHTIITAESDKQKITEHDQYSSKRN